MTPLEELLSQARLVRDRVVPPDIIPTTPHPHPGPAPAPGQASPPQDPRHTDEAPTHPAARDLRALCATLVTHTPATTVTHFLTDQLPEPRSALILACVLQLTDTEDAARFWWQYAAGAGQSAAAYCLHLHHLARGEEDTARFWHDQMDHTPHPAPAPAPDHGERLDTAPAATMLRVLHHLARQTPPRPSSATVTSLMDYMPTATAVGYLREPDMELPLPGPDFARTIRTLLTAAPRPADPLDTRTRPRRRPNRPAATPGRETPPDEAKEHALGQRGPGTRH
ncbi:hypothetical protein GTY83_01205 [Streptomyces sp. SID4928]|uniref:hypothetical protein n=1 Tax=unclassified Streptomyces TaxID=2593676 RepID=UPI0002034630|nr:hypothetical protein [Streptomyces sp. ACT-1]EGE39645.1 hypothetical protein SACT1_0239 [Streptomyces sp. ACT-1]MYR47732.1 hypothetical protein [Streptomyces sp. SID4928]